MYVIVLEVTETQRVLNRTSKTRAVGKLFIGVKFKSRDESFGWCALTTAIEHAAEDETPPLAVEPVQVSPKIYASAPATARSGVRNRWRLHLVTENDHFEQPKSHLQSQINGIFRQRAFEDYVT
jgi:hypothetical protein